MTLIDAVAGATGLGLQKVETTAGAILGAIRMSVSAATFAPVERAIPDYQHKLAGQLGRAALPGFRELVQ